MAISTNSVLCLNVSRFFLRQQSIVGRLLPEATIDRSSKEKDSRRFTKIGSPFPFWLDFSLVRESMFYSEMANTGRPRIVEEDQKYPRIQITQW